MLQSHDSDKRSLQEFRLKVLRSPAGSQKNKMKMRSNHLPANALDQIYKMHARPHLDY